MSPPDDSTEDQASKELESQILEDLQHAVVDNDQAWLQRTLDELHPADAADLLEQLSLDEFANAVNLLGGELAPEVLIELRDEYRGEAVDVGPGGGGQHGDDVRRQQCRQQPA